MADHHALPPSVTVLLQLKTKADFGTPQVRR
jgi:hypothetical protein